MLFRQDFYDAHKILFFDFDAVYEMRGVVQKWHQPEKHPSLIRPEKPWEGDMTMPESVFPHHDGDRLVCTYRCHHHPDRFPELHAAGLDTVTCRAESRDGFAWERPALGEVEFRGTRENNMIPGLPWRTILDARDPDPARRYKGIALRWPDSIPGLSDAQRAMGRCFYSATSADGIHWSAPRRMDGFEQTGDTDALSYDDRDSCYLFTTRKRGYWLDEYYPDFYKRPIKKDMPDGRWVALSTSRDFETWSALDNIIVRDAMDELGVDFYCACIFPYGDLYLGFLRRHHFWHGLMDTELVWSRDCRRWRRSWYRRPFLSWGELGDDDWCFGDVINSKPVRSGDRLLIFYEGRNHVHAPHANQGRGLPGMDARMGVATLRVDGFVSLEAGRMGGEFVTEPLPVAGKSVTINARTVGDSVAEIELLTPDRRPLGKAPLVFRGDDVALPLRFDGAERIAPTDSGLASLRVYLQNAAVYSINIGA